MLQGYGTEWWGADWNHEWIPRYTGRCDEHLNGLGFINQFVLTRKAQQIDPDWKKRYIKVVKNGISFIKKMFYLEKNAIEFERNWEKIWLEYPVFLSLLSAKLFSECSLCFNFWSSQIKLKSEVFFHYIVKFNDYFLNFHKCFSKVHSNLSMLTFIYGAFYTWSTSKRKCIYLFYSQGNV